MTKLFQRLAELIAVCLSIHLSIYGQAATDASKGSIGVTVRDATGATVPEAKVTAEGQMGGQTVNSNDRGEANFYGLIPGTYNVRVSKEGFALSETTGVIVLALLCAGAVSFSLLSL